MDHDRIEDLKQELIRERSLEALERLTGSNLDRVLGALIEAVGEIVDADVPQDEDDTIVEEIQSHLVRSAEIGPLVDALSNENASVREFALGCLGEMENLNAAEPMIARLEDPEPAVREAAAEHLSLLTDHDFGINPAAWRQWLAEQAEIATIREAEEREESKQRAKAKTKVLDVRVDEDEDEDEDGNSRRRDRDDDDDGDSDDDRRRRLDDDD
jgi:hypothetical protein